MNHQTIKWNQTYCNQQISPSNYPKQETQNLLQTYPSWFVESEGARAPTNFVDDATALLNLTTFNGASKYLKATLDGASKLIVKNYYFKIFLSLLQRLQYILRGRMGTETCVCTQAQSWQWPCQGWSPLLMYHTKAILIAASISERHRLLRT